MQYISQNNEHLEKMLDFYNEFYEKVENSNIRIILYGSLSYAYFTNDKNIDVNDIDFIAPEKDFQKIIDLVKDINGITYELTNHNSLRLLKNGAKLSIHSEEMALEIVDFNKGLLEIEINSSKFLSLSLLDLIEFYKKGCSYDVQRKTGYTDKLNNLVAKAYENHSFFLLKPSTISRNNSGEIIDFIKENEFEIIKQKEILLNPENVDYIYKDEYEALIPVLGEENSNKALEISHKMFDNKNIILILVKKENAIEESDKLKGSNFLPKKCQENTIRYIFRDKNHDNFEIPAGKIVETPSDNIVHAPKTKEEFVKIAIKWLI